MKNFQELVKEYGMEYRHLGGQKEYVEVLEQETRWLKHKRMKEQEEINLEKDFRQVVSSLFERGALRVVDSKKFADSFELRDSEGNDYPLWFFDAVKILIKCFGNKICFDVEKDCVMQIRMVKKLLENEATETPVISWLPGFHPLERIFSDGKIEDVLERGLSKESKRFANALIFNEEAEVLKNRIYESLNKEFLLLLKK